MKRLEPPDALHLQAAQGWLELGNYLEADKELDEITASLRAHPDVLKVRWEIYAAAKKWEAALDIAAGLSALRDQFTRNTPLPILPPPPALRDLPRR